MDKCTADAIGKPNQDQLIKKCVDAAFAPKPTASSPFDKDYFAKLTVYARCAEPIEERFMHSLDKLAILYPRFGIAWREQEADIEAETSRASSDPSFESQIAKIHQQFIDLMLRTAESEAIQFYNLADAETKHNIQSCGPIPQKPAQ